MTIATVVTLDRFSQDMLHLTLLCRRWTVLKFFCTSSMACIK